MSEPGESEKQVTSVPLDLDDGPDRPIEQEVVGRQSVIGGGEWPSPSAPSTGPAPGTTPEGAAAAEARDRRPPAPQPVGTATQADQQQDGRTAGSTGPARSADADDEATQEATAPAMFKRALAADPIAGGSRTTPDEDDA